MNVTPKFGGEGAECKKFCVTIQGSVAAMPTKPKISKSFPYQKIWVSEFTYYDLYVIFIKGGGEGYVSLLNNISMVTITLYQLVKMAQWLMH